MKILTTKSAWFRDSDLRLDASFHLSEGQITAKKIANAPVPLTTLDKETSSIFSGNIFKRAYVNSPEFGYGYLTGSDMMKSDINSGKFISKKYTKQVDKLRIGKHWILVSCSGTLGNVVFTNDDFTDKIGTHDLIRIIPSEDGIKAGYLYAFLASKYGYSLLVQSSYGGVVKHIEPHHIKNLPIPILPEKQQEEIHQLIVDAAQLRVEANRLLNEAVAEIEALFSFEKREKIFSTKISQIKAGDKYTNENRLECDFYQPSTLFLEKQIKANFQYDHLGNLCKSVTISNLRARVFVEKGITLFTGQSLGLMKPDMSKQMSRKFTKNIESNTTRDGDVLITAFGTLGKVEYCFQNFYSGVFASQQIARVRVDEDKIDSGYISLFLKSKVGQALIMKYKTGSVIEWANWNNFSSILIPIPEDKGKLFGEKARRITKYFEDAYQKETQAIQLIENEISTWQV